MLGGFRYPSLIRALTNSIFIQCQMTPTYCCISFLVLLSSVSEFIFREGQSTLKSSEFLLVIVLGVACFLKATVTMSLSFYRPGGSMTLTAVDTLSRMS